MQIIKVIGRTKRISKKEKTASGEFWLNIIGQNMYSERSFPKRCCCIALASAWTDVSAVPPWLLHILLLQSPYLFLSFTLSLSMHFHTWLKRTVVLIHIKAPTLAPMATAPAVPPRTALADALRKTSPKVCGSFFFTSVDVVVVVVVVVALIF